MLCYHHHAACAVGVLSGCCLWQVLLSFAHHEDRMRVTLCDCSRLGHEVPQQVWSTLHWLT